MIATEKRLIDANEFFARLQNVVYDVFGEQKSDFGYSTGIIKTVLEQTKTVDAVEVVHGKWIFKRNPTTDPKGYFIRIVCSECNLHTGQTSNYCPQCGAKMDGGNGDGS